MLLWFLIGLGCGGGEGHRADNGGDTDTDADADADDTGPAPSQDLDTGAGVMLALDAGTFTMGCTEPFEDLVVGPNSSCLNWAPPHEVTLTRGFWLGQTEVTRGAFRELMGYAPRDPDATDTWPVDTLTRFEQQAAANALSALEGLEECYGCTGEGADVWCEAKPDALDCGGYRLPTEAEWEYAARAGTDLVYSGSNRAEEVAWTRDSPATEYYYYNEGSLHGVAFLAANDWGFFDMSGNASEPVGDWYEVSSGVDATDPTGPATDTGYLLTRGGAASMDAEYSAVIVGLPGLGSGGLRLARTRPAAE